MSTTRAPISGSAPNVPSSTPFAVSFFHSDAATPSGFVSSQGIGRDCGDALNCTWNCVSAGLRPFMACAESPGSGRVVADGGASNP